MDLRAIYSLNRFREIVGVLIKYGLEDLVNRLNLPTLPMMHHAKAEYTQLSTWERIRLALQELGPSFIKLGQNLSLRPDLLPEGLILELRKLQDDVDSKPFEELKKVLEKSLEAPLEEVFSLFEEEPIAAASIAQVYRATLAENGKVVAIKIQRPGTEDIMDNDLSIMEAVAPWLHENYPDLQVYNLPGIIELTRRTIDDELDFRREARHMQIASKNMESLDFAFVPKPYMHLCTKHVLVMEYVVGKQISSLTAEDLEGARELGRQGLILTLTQILVHGLFHADPHPGNLLMTPDKRLCLLDWGMVGRLTPEDRDELIDLVKAVVNGQSEQLADALLTVVRPTAEVDRREIERALCDILDLYTTIPLKEVSLGQLLLDLSAMLRQHQLRMPPNIFFMVKAIVAAERCGRTLDPDLNVPAEAEPLIRELVSKRYHPDALLRKARSTWSSLKFANRLLPKQFAAIIRKLQQGEFTIRFQHENLRELEDTLENAADRLTFGIIVGSLIIGSSMIITTGVGPKLFGYPALGIIGFLLSGVLGLWLLYRIIRHQHRD